MIKMNYVMIKKALTVLGGVFVVQLIVFCFFLLSWSNLNKSSLDFTVSSITAIASNWDYKDLASRADPQMFAGNAETDNTKILSVISRIGKIQSFEGCGGEASVDAASSHFVVIAQYQCKIKFEKDTGVVTMVLTGNFKDMLLGKTSNDWKILRFNLASDYLVKTASPAPKS